MITPVAIESIGYKYYILYAILGACIPMLVYFLYPETMGRSLEQMNALFKEHDSIQAIVKASLKQPDPEIERLAEAAARKEFDDDYHHLQKNENVEYESSSLEMEKGVWEGERGRERFWSWERERYRDKDMNDDDDWW